MKYLITYIYFLAAFLASSCSQPPHEAEAEAFACRLSGETRWTLVTHKGDLLPLPDNGQSEPTAVVGSMYAMRGPDSLLHLHTTDSRLAAKVSPRGFFRVGYFFDQTTVAQSTAQTPFEIIDRQGNTRATLPDNVVMMHGFSEGRALVYTDKGKYGYVDQDGHMVIAPRWDYATDFQEGTALVGQLDNAGRMAYCFIAPSGAHQLDVPTHGAELGQGFTCGMLACYQPDTKNCFYLTTDGETALSFPDSIVAASPFQKGLAVVRTFQGTGITDTHGILLVPPTWEQARIVDADRILLYKNGLWQLAKANGKIFSQADFAHLQAIVPSSCLFIRRKGERTYKLMNAETAQIYHLAFDTVVTPPTALRLEPELFVRQTTENIPTKPVVVSSAKTHPQTETKPKRKTDVPQRVTYSASDWTKVKHDNPFYAEAVKVVSGKLEETDAERRRLILNYMEHLRTAYTTKDIDFLRQLFSERALIIVGTVVQASAQEETGYLSPKQVVYNVKSKQAYLNRLAELFKMNKKIDVQFSGFKIMRHPTVEGLYGVNLRQQYDSDIYSDDGYLFLLWDFRDPSAPQIHVRTWQPAFPDGHTPLNKEEVLDISSFNLQ